MRVFGNPNGDGPTFIIPGEFFFGPNKIFTNLVRHLTRLSPFPSGIEWLPFSESPRAKDSGKIWGQNQSHSEASSELVTLKNVNFYPNCIYEPEP
jgi:hypothetical protein